mgnify:CR=1 FL=1
MDLNLTKEEAKLIKNSFNDELYTVDDMASTTKVMIRQA